MFTDTELAYLRSQRIARLATDQPDGTLQVNPVGYGVNLDLGTIDIGGYGMAASRKFRNVAANGRAALVVDDVRSVDPWRVRFLELRGHAEAIEEPTDAQDQARGRLGSIIRFRPERILAMGLEPEEAELDVHQLRVRSRSVG